MEAPRRHPAGTSTKQRLPTGYQKAPRRHPGGNQEAPREHPETPRSHPGTPRGTQEKPDTTGYRAGTKGPKGIKSVILSSKTGNPHFTRQNPHTLGGHPLGSLFNPTRTLKLKLLGNK